MTGTAERPQQETEGTRPEPLWNPQTNRSGSRLSKERAAGDHAVRSDCRGALADDDGQRLFLVRLLDTGGWKHGD